MKLEGKIITGKWNKNSYKIIKILGKGGVGRVYKSLDINNKVYYALKISQDLHSITKEYNMLNEFNSIEALPNAVELDDYEEAGKKYYFLVLEYINGENFKEYMLKKQLKLTEIVGIVIIVSMMIREFHKKGYIFGDLKLENLMIDKENREIKVIDLGGIVPKGDSIKEFTPLYDRARWNIGLRSADTKYDMFAICIMCVNLILGNEKELLNMTLNDAMGELRKRKINKKVVNLIEKGLYQNRIEFFEFIEELKKIYKTLRNERKIRYNYRVNLIVNAFFIISLLSFTIILVFVIRNA
ncbi:protein kinase domain-containing protein [Paramaledivibacter caminithermalis]|jgi:serine/threonine-protein kinase|uniref:Serine/threonine protein kinase n=1 Tax=Paramaledivibacter caminithermalis (strain DSM 15212 / CIP 107654 / DViRD3) TaxID=1121301 RepID=A0A1M6N0B1_PARC5|nr:protein kinase [Paramaledivibacter caminithermalis]SHJ89120.1 serine/threonine protein kinase [Paramaledivibacter caminithermalis DSM 15212]